ncbi:hypothetical protein [Fimbriiglobus ruber]|uniref:Uncharacterized protein n=1 Tax=Fimbriiglobus ruber TaxID=1908690 RepID=A0A225E6R4_9BACT|nr:hypothetical protein [Fimbriiglobus ruber]OWK45189.1 hypothetical protein FRUB_01520 [Fimbriiglobus ruber]
MTLPKWNNDWEKPDPLRGQRGWSRHHYATVFVAAVVLAIAFGLVMPVVVKLRRQEQEMDRLYEELRTAMALAASSLPVVR